MASDTTIAELYEILQSAFDWSGEHLHRFLIHGSAYGIRCPGGIVFEEDARGVPLTRFGLHCGGGRRAIGDLDELREAVDRVKAYQEFQPGKFDRRKLNAQLRTLAQDREVRDDLQDSNGYHRRGRP
jgi:Plasmid pRiA4b ORF-3-like protein